MTTPNRSLELALAEAKRIAETAGASPVTELSELQGRLTHAIRLIDSGATDRPVIVTFLGGTGAGKSELFNTLSGAPGASPVSSAERAFTRELHVAAHAGDAGLLPLDPDQAPKHVAAGPRGLALIDAPDVDSAVVENRTRARAALEASDVIVYVALPEKRSSFVITEEMKLWAGRKQWFFVLNKVDLAAPGEVGAIRADFEARIRDAGFDPSPDHVFVISAKTPDHPQSEFHRLRGAIYSARSKEEAQALRDLTAFRALAHALDGGVLNQLDRLDESLGTALVELEQTARDSYLRILSSKTVRESLTDLVRARVWRSIPSRVGGFLAAPLWIVARMNQLWLTFSLTRIATGGMSIAGLAHALWVSLVSYVRGVLPLQSILSAFGRKELQELNGVRLDSIRKLEDLGVDWVDRAPDPEVAPQPVTGGDAKWSLPLSLDPHAGVAPEKTNVLRTLTDAIEGSSAEGAARSINWVHRLFGNLLPLIAFADVTRKALGYWIEDDWLPGDFYLMAIFLFILSTVPGCLLVSAGVRARAKIGEAGEIISGMTELWETEPLAATRRHVAEIKRQVLALNRKIERQISILRELNRGHLSGASAKEQTDQNEGRNQ